MARQMPSANARGNVLLQRISKNQQWANTMADFTKPEPARIHRRAGRPAQAGYTFSKVRGLEIRKRSRRPLPRSGETSEPASQRRRSSLVRAT